MSKLKASETRIPPDTFNRVAYLGERVGIERRGGDVIYLVSQEDYEFLSKLEDQVDILAADEALSDMTKRKQKPIPWEELKARLGL